MKLKDRVKEVIDSGIMPIAFDFEEVNFFSEEGGAVIRSFMVVNSLDLGTLTYRQYRFVARRTKQGDRLVERHIKRLFQRIPAIFKENPKIECFTIPTYARLLKNGVLARMLFDAFSLYPEISPEMICIELSADILYENIEEARQGIAELREIGVKIAISEVGDEFCPVFRLSEFEFDYAFLDEFATATLDHDERDRVARSLVRFLHFLDVKIIAPCLDSQEKIDGAKLVGCDGYTTGPVPEFTPLPTAVSQDAPYTEPTYELASIETESITREEETAEITLVTDSEGEADGGNEMVIEAEISLDAPVADGIETGEVSD